MSAEGSKARPARRDDHHLAQTAHAPACDPGTQRSQHVAGRVDNGMHVPKLVVSPQ
jgi:hypothetical protein